MVVKQHWMLNAGFLFDINTKMATRTKVTTHEIVQPDVMVQPRKTIAERIFPLLLAMLFLETFLLGAMWTKVKYLEQEVAKAPTGGAPVAGQQQPPAQVEVTQDQIKNVFSSGVITFGDPNAKLLLVEIADPSCPFCHVAAGHNPELSSQMGAQFKLASDGGTYVSPVIEMKKLVDSGKAAFAWVYSNGHGAGEVATKAMYCAHDQGKFWQAHDLLMSNKGYELINNVVKNDKTKYVDISSFLGGVLNAGDLKKCLDGGKYDSRLAKEQQLSQSLGVSGTPGFFVNTKNFAGAYSWTDMKPDADAAL